MPISWNYPTVNHAEEAAMDALPKLLSGDIQQHKNDLVKDATCIVAYGAGIGFPADGIILSQPKKSSRHGAEDGGDEETDVENTATDPVAIQLATAIQPIADHHERLDNAPARTGAPRKAAVNVDWKNIASLALRFLLSILGCALFLLLVVSAGRAHAQDLQWVKQTSNSSSNSLQWVKATEKLCGCETCVCDPKQNCGCFGIVKKAITPSYQLYNGHFWVSRDGNKTWQYYSTPAAPVQVQQNYPLLNYGFYGGGVGYAAPYQAQPFGFTGFGGSRFGSGACVGGS
jgi:hypothetical protein